MPADHVLKTIELVQQQIAELDAQLLEKKRMVNDLCGLADRPPAYADADLSTTSATTTTRPDEYYGKPLATVVRLVLEKRLAANLGAATANEIYEEMVAGGYHFQAKNDENAKRGLYSSLGKNTQTFHRLPNNTYGLREWYPDAPKAKGNGKSEERPLHEELQEEAAAEEAEASTSTQSSAK